MNRRRLLTHGGLALAGLGLNACAPRTTRVVAAPAAPRRPMVQLPLVRVSAERVIRQTVGLRPHRPSGFVLKAGTLDAKTIIHNYGHGGSGFTLSWGEAAEVAHLLSTT